jgi:hypothetical protein
VLINNLLLELPLADNALPAAAPLLLLLLLLSCLQLHPEVGDLLRGLINT